MEGVDFSVDRARLLPGALSASSLTTPLGATYVPDSGYVAPLGRSGAAVSGVPELGRAGTPPGLNSLGQYQNRYYPPSVSMHSPGKYQIFYIETAFFQNMHTQKTDLNIMGEK